MQERGDDRAEPAVGEDAPAVEQNDVEAPADPFEEAVLAELEKIRNPKGNWVQTLVILAVSLVAFFGLGMRDHPLAFTAALVGVLFFHELGHYVGMRIFGYRNVRMFFIPLFGAAVSGRKTSVKSYQEAIVTLLGPLPGLCLALVLWGSATYPGLRHDVQIELIRASLLLGIINGFNLLPVLPLDGGRVLNQILFSRNRYLEAVFQILAAIALIAYGAAQDQRFLMFLGIWIAMTIAYGFKTSSIAQRVGGALGDQLPPPDEAIPPGLVRIVIGQVRERLPAVTTPKAMAGAVFQVWEKMHVRPPSAAASSALLVVYLLGAAVGLGMYQLPLRSNSIERQIASMAREMNKGLPRQIDQFTRLDHVEPGPGKSYCYVYTLSFVPTEEQKRLMEDNTVRQAHAAPELRPTLDAGVTVRYRYHDRRGRKVLEFAVTAQ